MRQPSKKLSTIAVPSFIIVLLFQFIFYAPSAQAALPFSSGAYQGRLWTDPAVIPVNKAQLYLSLQTQNGVPVEGATLRVLAKMPGMDMGEKETVAQPVSGQPGVYVTPAVFSMAGGYEITVRIDGPQGATTATVPVSTGQNTGGPEGGGGIPLLPLIFGVALVLLIVFSLYRMKKTGQQIHARSLFNGQVIGGLVLIALMLLISSYLVNNYRRKGAMTPIESQAMEMNTPAPPGTTAVELATVERGAIQNTVRYAGSAVGYTEQNLYPRVTGWMTWMPFYAGDRVKRGQLLARLDTSQIEPQVAERRAGVNMARQGVDVARTEYQQALTMIAETRADLAGKQSAVDEARANLTAAREERANAAADLAAAETRVTEARAMLAAAQADQAYWQKEIKRAQVLQQEGAISRDEYQKEVAQSEMSAAKVRQARANVAQMQAMVRAAQAQIRKADAMIRAATTKIRQTESEREAGRAKIRTAQAAADAAQRRIGQAQAGVEQAQAGLGSATATRGYSEITSPVDGVVTERFLSPGVLVSPGQAILKIAQIRPIRLQASVPEADLNVIEIGSPVTVRDRAGKRPPIRLKVTSITPTVDPSARTGIVEATYPNAEGRFAPGEFVEMEITTGQKPNALWVPTRAVQIQTRPTGGILSTQTASTVWVAEPAAGGEAEYTVRQESVTTGLNDGSRIEIISGLREGQRVVVNGTDGLRDGDTVTPVGEMIARSPTGSSGPASTEGADHSGHAAPSKRGDPGDHSGHQTSKGESPPAKSEVQTASVTVTNMGYEPATLTLKEGVPARLTFTRTVEEGCGTEIVFPDYEISKPLPLNQPVMVEFTPKKTGEVKFTCGMDMFRGKVVVR